MKDKKKSQKERTRLREKVGNFRSSFRIKTKVRSY